MSSSSPASSTASAAITKAVQVATIFTVSAAAGSTLAQSYLVVPQLLESPTPLMLRQFVRTMYRGRNSLLPADILSALGFFWLAAFASPRSSTGGGGGAGVSARTATIWYGLAGALSVSIVPFTRFFVLPINRKLLRRAEETQGLAITDEVVEPADEHESSRNLVDLWGVLNLGRTVLVATAGVLGLYASL